MQNLHCRYLATQVCHLADQEVVRTVVSTATSNYAAVQPAFLLQFLVIPPSRLLSISINQQKKEEDEAASTHSTGLGLRCCCHLAIWKAAKHAAPGQRMLLLTGHVLKWNGIPWPQQTFWLFIWDSTPSFAGHRPPKLLQHQAKAARPWHNPMVQVPTGYQLNPLNPWNSTDWSTITIKTTTLMTKSHHSQRFFWTKRTNCRFDLETNSILKPTNLSRQKGCAIRAQSSSFPKYCKKLILCSELSCEYIFRSQGIFTILNLTNKRWKPPSEKTKHPQLWATIADKTKKRTDLRLQHACLQIPCQMLCKSEASKSSWSECLEKIIFRQLICYLCF